MSNVLGNYNFVSHKDHMRKNIFLISCFYFLSSTFLPGLCQVETVDVQIEKIKVLKDSQVQHALREANDLYGKAQDFTPKQQVHLLDLLGSLTKDNLEYNASKGYYYRLAILAESEAMEQMRFKGILGMVDILRHQGRYDSAVYLCQKILAEENIDEYPAEQGLAIKELGDIFRFQGKLDLAYSSYLTAKDILEATDDPVLMTKADLGLAEVFHLQGKYDLAADYFKRVLKIRKDLGNSESLANTYSRVGNTYETLGDQAKAFSYFDTALAVYTSIGNLRGVANSKRKIAKILRRWELYDSAEAYLKDAFTTFQSVEDVRQLSKVCRQLGIVHRKQGKYDSALFYSTKSANFAEKIGFVLGHYLAISDVVTVYQELGNYKKAYERQIDLLKIQEALMQDRFDNKITAVEMASNLQKNLLNREKELNELHSTSRNRTILLLAITTTLLALFIVFAYRQYLKDISRLKKIRNQNTIIRSKNKEIAIRIEELKQFAYVTSHDLKTPLTGIMKISEWFARDYGHNLDHQGSELLDLMKQRVLKMENLLNGILSYFKVGSSDLSPARQQLEPLVREVVESIETPKTIDLEILNEKASLFVDRSQLRQVLFNIIDNSVRYNDRFTVQIKVGIKKRDKNWYLFVQDNGRGIEDRFQRKVFDMFQRINDEDENGTGIGLAIVKRIVEGWNSKIFIESDPGIGSTIFIRLNREMIIHDKNPERRVKLKLA